MPYARNSDAPADVRQRFSGECLTVWRRVFNDTLARHRNEKRAFATAETAGKRCKAAKAEERPVADLSFNQRQDAVRAAIQNARGKNCYVVELYDDRAVYEEWGDDGSAGKFFEVAYTIDEDSREVTLGERTEVVRETNYRAVKFVDEDAGLIEGLAIPFGGPIAGKDLTGEDFGPDTDFCSEWFPEGRPILYHHGLNAAVKTELVGRQVDAEERDDGLWVKGELAKASRYRKKVAEIIRSGKAGFSSGAIPHLVQTKADGHITRWPWVELSITPTPANPSAMVYAVKSAPVAFTDKPGEGWGQRAAELFAEGLKNADGSGSESFDAHTERVASEVADLLERAQKRAEVRAAKAGRELSSSNREGLRALHKRLGSLAELQREVKEALDRTDPDAKKALVELEVELAISELRRAGLPV